MVQGGRFKFMHNLCWGDPRKFEPCPMQYSFLAPNSFPVPHSTSDLFTRNRDYHNVGNRVLTLPGL